MKLIYISGKITDESREKEVENMARFDLKEFELSEKGYEVFNPASLETKGWTWEQYLARDLIWIHNNTPTLYMMTGWQESRGARLEHQYAKFLRLPIIYEEE